MRNTSNLLLTLLFCATIANAQSYKWVKGGGSAADLSVSGDYEQVTHMCTDDNGNVYTTEYIGVNNILADTFYRALAHNSYAGSIHVLFTSYSCDGTMRFAKIIEAWDNNRMGNIIYSNGSIYLSGTLASQAPGHLKYVGDDTTMPPSYLSSYTLRYDTSGKFKWMRFLGNDVFDNLSNTLLSGILATDELGNIHNFCPLKAGVVLSPTVTTVIPGSYNIKYDTAGNMLSADIIPILDSNWAVGNAIYNHRGDKWYALVVPNAWYYYDTHFDYNSGVWAFRGDNSFMWRDTIGAQGNVANIAYDGENDIYATGQATYAWGPAILGGDTVIFPPGTHNASTIYKLDTLGIAKWVYALTGDNINVFEDITLLPNHHVAATGLMAGTLHHGSDSIAIAPGEGQNPSLAIVDSSGHTVFIDQLHGSSFYDWGTAITSDKAGNIYVGGMTEYDISGTGLSPYISNGGNSDFFIAKYGYECNCLLSPPVASFTSTVAGTTAPFAATFTYTGTTTYDSIRWTFGDGSTANIANPSHTYATAGTYNACVTIYSQCGNNTYCNTIHAGTTGVSLPSHNEVLIYPNPSDGQLIIANAEDGTAIEIYDITGRLLYTGSIKGDKEIINMASWVSGSYLLRLTDTNGNRNAQTIIRK